MKKSKKVPMKDDLPNWESDEYLSPEWLLNAPDYQVSIFLREAGFDHDKGLSPAVKRAIEDNRKLAKQIDKRNKSMPGIVAQYCLGKCVFLFLTILTALICINVLKSLSLDSHRGIFLFVAAIVIWICYALSGYKTYVKVVTRNAMAAILLTLNLYGVCVFFEQQRGDNFQPNSIKERREITAMLEQADQKVLPPIANPKSESRTSESLRRGADERYIKPCQR